MIALSWAKIRDMFTLDWIDLETNLKQTAQIIRINLS